MHALAPAPIRHKKLLRLITERFESINGRHTRHEKAEKKKIITELFSPILPSLRTKVYATPAPKPPRTPINAGNTA